MQKRVRRGIAFILILVIAAGFGGISSLAAGAHAAEEGENLPMPSGGASAGGMPDAGIAAGVPGQGGTATALANSISGSPAIGDLPEIIDIEETLPPLEPSAEPSPARVEEPPPAPVVDLGEPDLPLADAPATGESLLLYFLITLLMASAYGLAFIAVCEYREYLGRRKQ